MSGTRTRSGVREVLAFTADATLTNEDLGKIITNRGATGAVIITLPTVSADNKGGTIVVRSVVNQDLTINSATNDKIVILNDAAADSVAFSTTNEKIGGGGSFTSDGTGWLFANLSAGANTITTAT